jgi:hypothetical protein
MEHDSVDLITILPQEVAEAARFVIVHVLEKQNPSGHGSIDLAFDGR